eukprot:333447-Amphidinium_carterae.1
MEAAFSREGKLPGRASGCPVARPSCLVVTNLASGTSNLRFEPHEVKGKIQEFSCENFVQSSSSQVDQLLGSSSSRWPKLATQTRAPTALQQRLSFETLRSGVFIPLKAAAFSSHAAWENPID